MALPINTVPHLQAEQEVWDLTAEMQQELVDSHLLVEVVLVGLDNQIHHRLETVVLALPIMVSPTVLEDKELMRDMRVFLVVRIQELEVVAVLIILLEDLLEVVVLVL